MPSQIKTYDGSEDLEDHLKIFQAAAKTERWAMPTWCHMFNSTLTGNARKKYIKDHIELHNIKQRDGESTKDFVRRYKLESTDVKGALECMRISGFVHGITNPELIKRLHDKIPKIVDEMMRVITSFLRGKWHPRIMNERNRFHHGNNKRGSDEDEGTEGLLIIEAEIGGHCIRRMYVDGGSTSEILYEHCFDRLRPEIKNQLVPATTPFKCFLDAYKGYHQIQMAKKDEEKTAFITSQGIICYTKMPFGLRNAGATYQRLVDKAFHKQIGRNLEVCVDDLVIKICTEDEIVKDIK
ncbi:reverse transcriptase domain-containing protein [Tanacetum coccineum]